MRAALGIQAFRDFGLVLSQVLALSSLPVDEVLAFSGAGILIGFVTLVFCTGAGSSLEPITHNKKSVKQMEIMVAETLICLFHKSCRFSTRWKINPTFHHLRVFLTCKKPLQSP